MKELFNSRGIFILGDLQNISGSASFKSGEISLDANTISFKYDKNQTYHRLKISEVKQVFYLPRNNYIEIIDVIGLYYRYSPTSESGNQAVIDMYKLDELANLLHKVKSQSKPKIIESEFDKKKIQKERIHRVIKEREIREKQQFKQQMEIIYTKLANEKTKKLAKILAASKSIKNDIVMEVLKIDSTTFHSDILPIAVDFGFTLEGEKLNYTKYSIPEFIYKLTNYFFVHEKKITGPKLTIKAPKPKKATESQSESAALTADQLEEEQKALEKTEQEVSVQREKFVCVVHKGPIEGDNYLCPSCFTFYCLKCAKTLKKQGEDCWTCGTEFRIKSAPGVSSDVLDEVQKLEDKRNSLKKTAINLDESFYAGAIEKDDYIKMKDTLVDKIIKLNSQIADIKKEKLDNKES
jgi:hypothetical protein